MLNRLDQVKALSDSLRIKILDHFCNEALTTKQVAGLLGEPPHKLYHHVDALESAGLIVLEKTKQNRGTIEKYFRAVAKHFTLSPHLFEVQLDGDDLPATEKTFSAVLQNTLTEVKQSLETGLLKSGDPFFAHLKIQLNQKQANELHQKLQEWIDLARKTSSDEGDEIYGSVVAFYPQSKV